MKQPHGWALPSTICALAILLSTIHLLSFESLDALHIAAEIHRGEKLHTAVATFIRDSPPSFIRCENLPVSFEGNTLSYEVCRETVRPFLTLPASVSLPTGLVDYEALFSQASACPTRLTPALATGAASPSARNDCALPNSMEGSVTLLENIRSESTTFSEAGDQGSLRIATPGQITFLGEVRISQDLLVVAGGDINLATLRALPGSAVRVTILSSLGAIRVGAVEGNVALVIMGRSSIEAPETKSAFNFPLPPFRKPSVYSFRSKS